MGCGSGGGEAGTGGSGGVGGTGGLGGSGGGVPASSVLGFVLDPDGIGVSGATIGERALTDSAGVALGAVNAKPSGWAPVEAIGYLSGATRAYAKLSGRDLFETRLTPSAAAIAVDAAGAVDLTTGEADPRLFVSVDGVKLDRSPVLVEAGLIDRLDVEPRWQKLSDGRRLRLWGAFGLSARDEKGANAALVAGETLDVSLRDGGELSSSLELASFDLESGSWLLLPSACARVDTQHLECTLPKLGSLFGLFDPAPAAGGGQSLMSGVAGDEQYQQAGDAFGDAITEHFGDDPSGGSWDDLPDSIKDLFEDWVDAALDVASGNAPEAAKGHVLRVEMTATLLGAEALRAKLHDKAVELANQRAAQVLADADCGMIRELLAAIEQLELFGGDAGLEAELRAKVEELMQECNTWAGQIAVEMALMSDYAETGVTRRSGASHWVEKHKLFIQVNPESGQVGGQDSLSLSFPEVLYDSDDAEECPPSYQLTFSGSGGGLLRVEGSFDGQKFTASLVPEGSSSFVLTRHDKVTAYLEEECSVEWDQTIPFLTGWFGVIVQGLGMGGPPMTFQDLLDASDVNVNGNGEPVRFTGVKFNVSLGAPEGAYPFDKGSIVWSLVRPDLL
ncbi:MAG: hypothetical protein IPM35_06530 [Myxococcales bacterium]|nr:hypothetical protein [Myxococcales bacterium]